MDYLTQASQLGGQAEALLVRPERDGNWWQLANQKAVEIGEFLQNYGSMLDAAGSSHMVDALGQYVDKLAAGVQVIRKDGGMDESPAKAFVKSLWNDATNPKPPPDDIMKWVKIGIAVGVLIVLLNVMKLAKDVTRG